MKKHVLDLFPSPVAVIEEFLTCEECNVIFNFCIDYKNKLPNGSHHLLKGDSYSLPRTSDYWFIDTLDRHINFSLSDKISEQLVLHSELLGLPKMQISNSWFNIQNEGSVLEQHTHPNSTISGALYINADQGSNEICFENPVPYIWNVHYVDGKTKYSGRYFKIKPQNGMLILFPSWMRHGSLFAENKTNNRLVVSFNCWEFESLKVYE